MTFKGEVSNKNLSARVTTHHVRDTWQAPGDRRPAFQWLETTRNKALKKIDSVLPYWMRVAEREGWEAVPFKMRGQGRSYQQGNKSHLEEARF